MGTQATNRQHQLGLLLFPEANTALPAGRDIDLRPPVDDSPADATCSLQILLSIFSTWWLKALASAYILSMRSARVLLKGPGPFDLTCMRGKAYGSHCLQMACCTEDAEQAATCSAKMTCCWFGSLAVPAELLRSDWLRERERLLVLQTGSIVG